MSLGKAGPTRWTSPKGGSPIASVATGPPNTGLGAAVAWGAEVLRLTGAMAGRAGAQALPLPGWARELPAEPSHWGASGTGASGSQTPGEL